MIIDVNTLVLSILIVTIVNILFIISYNLKHKDNAINFFIKSNCYYIIAFVIVVFKGNFFHEFGVYLQNLFILFGAVYELLSIMLMLEIIKIKNSFIFRYFAVATSFYIIFYFFKLDIVTFTAIYITIMLVIFIYFLHNLKKNSFIASLLEVIYVGFLFLMVLRSFVFENSDYAYKLSVVGLLILRMGSTLGFLFISREKIDKELLYYATYDGLTNILNRRTFISDSEFFLSSISKNQSAFLLIDIDFFKKINDTYGHLIGDNILVEFSRFLKSSIRQEDLCGRYGGEEFGILLKNVNENEAVDFSNKLIREIGNKKVNGINFTVSIGLSMFTKEKTIDDLYREADIALYKAKETGRNKVVLFEENNL